MNWFASNNHENYTRFVHLASKPILMDHTCSCWSTYSYIWNDQCQMYLRKLCTRAAENKMFVHKHLQIIWNENHMTNIKINSYKLSTAHTGS